MGLARPWRPSPRRWLIFGLPGACVFVFAWMASAPRILFSDFLKAYYPAGVAVWTGPSAMGPLVEPLVFVNIPGLAWLFAPLAFVGEPQLAAWLFFGVGVSALIATLMLLVGIAERATAPAFLLLFLVNGPAIYSLREGNTSHIVLFLLSVGLVLWRRDRQYCAGLVFGLCAMVKMPLLLLGAYFLVARRWRVAAGAATSAAAAVAISLALLGSDMSAAWFEKCIRPFMKGAVAAYNVQTIDAFLIRLETGQIELRNYMPLDRSHLHSAIRVLIVGTLLLVAALRLRGRATPGPPDGQCVLEFCLALTVAIIVSPLSWTHYYCFLLLPWCLHLGGNLPVPQDFTTRLLLGASIILASLPVLRSDSPVWHGPVTSRTLASAWLGGGVLLFAALLRGTGIREVSTPRKTWVGLRRIWRKEGRCRAAFEPWRSRG